MNIIASELYEKQLKEILEEMVLVDFNSAKNFKSYLDTIIINIPTKYNKYKKSVYFDDENIRDVVHGGFVIPFYTDESNKTFVILGIVETK
jgi:hypothetical protein